MAPGHVAVASQVALRPPDVICQTRTPPMPQPQLGAGTAVVRVARDTGQVRVERFIAAGTAARRAGVPSARPRAEHLLEAGDLGLAPQGRLWHRPELELVGHLSERRLRDEDGGTELLVQALDTAAHASGAGQGDRRESPDPYFRTVGTSRPAWGVPPARARRIASCRHCSDAPRLRWHRR